MNNTWLLLEWTSQEIQRKMDICSVRSTYYGPKNSLVFWTYPAHQISLLKVQQEYHVLWSNLPMSMDISTYPSIKHMKILFKKRPVSYPYPSNDSSMCVSNSFFFFSHRREVARHRDVQSVPGQGRPSSVSSLQPPVRLLQLRPGRQELPHLSRPDRSIRSHLPVLVIP
jgi:hypothetical protein